MRLRPSRRERPAASLSLFSTRAHMPPTVCQSTRMSSETVLVLQLTQSHATCSSKAAVKRDAEPSAQGTASTRTPCSGQRTRRGAYSRKHIVEHRSSARQRRMPLGAS